MTCKHAVEGATPYYVADICGVDTDDKCACENNQPCTHCHRWICVEADRLAANLARVTAEKAKLRLALRRIANAGGTCRTATEAAEAMERVACIALGDDPELLVTPLLPKGRGLTWEVRQLRAAHREALARIEALEAERATAGDPVLVDGWYRMPEMDEWIYMEDCEWSQHVSKSDNAATLQAYGGKAFHAYGGGEHRGAHATLEEAKAAALQRDGGEG